MIVVLDSNIWISEIGLKSSLGAVTRFYINNNNGKIALPEVVRLEVEHTIRNTIKELINDIQKNHRILLAIFGTLKELILPNESEVEQIILSIFSDLGVELFEVPFTFESAKISFLKTINKNAPSDQYRQEFKDGVLWADCINLLSQDNVCLVTNDKAFYRDKDYTKGLATTLRDETSGKTFSLKIISGLSQLLPELKSDVELDDDILANAFIEHKRNTVFGLMEKYGYELGQRISSKKKIYITENAKILYVEFEMSYECNDISGGNKNTGLLVMKGDCNYYTDIQLFKNIRDFGDEFNYYDNEGPKKIRNIVIHTEGFVFGHKSISHKVKAEIE